MTLLLLERVGLSPDEAVMYLHHLDPAHPGGPGATGPGEAPQTRLVEHSSPGAPGQP